MLSSSSSSSSSHQYASVIKATAELQTDLSNALATIRTLQQEKEYVLTQNHTLLNENQTFRNDIQQINQRIVQEQQQRIQLEKQYEKVNQEWRKLLEETRTKHLNELAKRTLITPEDMDQLRQYANNQEHRAIKAEIIQKDLQTKYENLQNELELTKRTASTTAVSVARENEITLETASTTIKELRYTIEQSQQSQNQQETMLKNQLRELRCTHDEMIAKVSALTMELNLVRDERDRLRQWEQQIDIEKARELTNTIAERRALETEKAVAERRAVGNAAEAASLRNALNETTTRLATTATELQQLRNEVSIKQRTFDDELYAMKTQYTTEQSAWEKEKEQLIRTNEDTVQRAIMEARKQSDERANECENALQNLQEKYTVADERIKELTNELNTPRSHVVGPSRPSSRLGGTMINTNISGMNSVTGSRRGSVHERSRRGSVVGLVPPHSDGHDTMEREDTVSKTKAKPSSPVALGSFHPTLPQGTLVSETPRQLVNEGEVTRLMGSSSLSGQEMLGSQSLSLKNNLLLHHYPHAYSSSSLSPSHPVTKGLTESIDTINQGIPSLNVVLSSSSSASSSLEIAYAEIASLNGEVQTLRYTIQDLRTTITALQVQLSRSMASVTEANKLRTEAENRTREMELQSTLLRGQIDNHVETIHQLQQDIVTLKDTVQLDRSSHIAQQNTIHASYEQMLFNEQQQRKTTEDELVALRHNLTVAQRKATAYKDRLLRLYEMYKLMKGHVQIMDPHLLLLEENK